MGIMSEIVAAANLERLQEEFLRKTLGEDAFKETQDLLKSGRNNDIPDRPGSGRAHHHDLSSAQRQVHYRRELQKLAHTHGFGNQPS